VVVVVVWQSALVVEGVEARQNRARHEATKGMMNLLPSPTPLMTRGAAIATRGGTSSTTSPMGASQGP